MKKVTKLTLYTLKPSMGSGFVFGFGGEDIQDPLEEELRTQNSFQEEDKGLKIDNNRTGRPARSHNLQEIVSEPAHAIFICSGVSMEGQYLIRI